MNKKEATNMICPKCAQQAISFLKFTLIDPRKITCSNCKAPLKANKKLRIMFWKLVVYVFCMLCIAATIIFIFKLEDSGLVVLISLLLPGVWYEYKEWKVGGYELLESKESSQDDTIDN